MANQLLVRVSSAGLVAQRSERVDDRRTRADHPANILGVRTEVLKVIVVIEQEFQEPVGGGVAVVFDSSTIAGRLEKGMQTGMDSVDGAGRSAFSEQGLSIGEGGKACFGCCLQLDFFEFIACDFGAERFIYAGIVIAEPAREWFVLQEDSEIGLC